MLPAGFPFAQARARSSLAGDAPSRQTRSAKPRWGRGRWRGGGEGSKRHPWPEAMSRRRAGGSLPAPSASSLATEQEPPATQGCSEGSSLLCTPGTGRRRRRTSQFHSGLGKAGGKQRSGFQKGRIHLGGRREARRITQEEKPGAEHGEGMGPTRDYLGRKEQLEGI